ncbi:MAG: ethanolamine ammonia-lyase subunit EutC [Planctomycetia bacterium]|nr:ethanolamine ammonia-lyase subunit EutC [Planctomycetia bacterium]
MSDSPVSAADGLEPLSLALTAIRARTPARILAGRAGASYRTATQLELRRDHPAAIDAVHAEVKLDSAFDRAFVERWRLFEVQTQARTKSEFLMRPDLGRRLDEAARTVLTTQCASGSDLQVVIGDGLSVAAVVKQAPLLLPALEREAQANQWTFGRPFAVRYCRVGVLNDIGEALDPAVVVLLIGERPGLATAESLSAYLAYRPRLGHTDAQRNLISNIHGRGVPIADAARRIAALANRMRELQTSGVAVKEDLPQGPALAP